MRILVSLLTREGTHFLLLSSHFTAWVMDTTARVPEVIQETTEMRTTPQDLGGVWIYTQLTPYFIL